MIIMIIETTSYLLRLEMSKPSPCTSRMLLSKPLMSEITFLNAKFSMKTYIYIEKIKFQLKVLIINKRK